MILALILGLIGLGLSALFSGTETGFYRVPRMRLVLDALGGDWIARALVWLANYPFIVVATTLAGNNLANYLVSLAIVLAAGSLFGESQAAEMLMPLALAPVLFVYGELLPKNLFLQAPNRMLRAVSPLFFVFAVVFAPVSLFLWGVNWILSRLVSERAETVRLVLARRELRRVLDEGHEVGLLVPLQRQLAEGTLAIAERPVTDYAMRLADVPRAKADTTRDEILRIARRYRTAVVCIEAAQAERTLIGYVRVIDLALAADDGLPTRPLMTVMETDTHLDALMRMQAAREDLAQIVVRDGRRVGILSIQRLREPLFRGGE